MARLKRSEINAIGAPNRPTGFAHARGHQGDIFQRYVRGGADGTTVVCDGLERGDELIQALNLSSSQPAADGTTEPQDLKEDIYVTPIVEVGSIEITNPGSGYAVPPSVTISPHVGVAEITEADVSVTIASGAVNAVTINNNQRGLYYGAATDDGIGGVTLTFSAPASGTTATGRIRWRDHSARLRMGVGLSNRRLACTLRRDR